MHEWRVAPSSRSERHLVTWHVLAQGGVGLSPWATSWGALGAAPTQSAS